MADLHRFIIAATKQTVEDNANEEISLKRKKITQYLILNFTAKKSLFTAVECQSISLKSIRVKGQSQSVLEIKRQLADLTAVLSFFTAVKW